MRTDEQLLQDMATDMRLAGLAERTVEAYTYAVRRLARTCVKAIAEINQSDVRAYLDGMVRSDPARGT